MTFHIVLKVPRTGDSLMGGQRFQMLGEISAGYETSWALLVYLGLVFTESWDADTMNRFDISRPHT